MLLTSEFKGDRTKLDRDEMITCFSSFDEFCKRCKTVFDVGSRTEVPFILNGGQRKIASEITSVLKMPREEKPHTMDITKCRRMGGSALMKAIVQYISTTAQNMNLVYVMQDDTAAEMFCDRQMKPFFENTHPSMMPVIEYRKTGMPQFIVRSLGKAELNNTMSFISANTKSSLGTGNHVIIYDEVGAYRAYTRTMELMSATLPKDGFSLQVLISTLYGINDFYDVLDVARNGLSGDKFVFVPWWEIEKYEMLETPQVEVPQEIIDEQIKYLEDENFDVDTIERKMNWYKYMYWDFAKGNKAAMHRAYPGNFKDLADNSENMAFNTKMLRGLLEHEKGGQQIFFTEDRGKVKAVDASRSPIEIFQEYNPLHRYIIGVDPSEMKNDNADSTHILVLDSNTLEDALRVDANDLTEDELVDMIEQIWKYYNRPRIVVESNAGKWVSALLKTRNIPLWVNPKTNQIGVRTTNESKNQFVQKIDYLITSGKYKPRGALAVTEFMHYGVDISKSGMKRYNARGKFSDNERMRDDAVMATAMAFELMSEKQILNQSEQSERPRLIIPCAL